MTKDSPDSATDDTRSADSKEGDRRRAELAEAAWEGLRDALKTEHKSPSPLSHQLEKTPASGSLGTPAEGMIEDGEGASPLEVPMRPQMK